MRAMGLWRPSYWPCVVSSMNGKALFLVLLGGGGGADEEGEGWEWGWWFLWLFC